jgi:site-specific DNA-methyltransferase (adenine-specific)
MSLENAGFEIRDCVYHLQGQGFPKSHNIGKKIKEYDGYGSQLKPAVEVWWLIRKPFKGSIVDNVLKYGTGALNIDKSRIGVEERTNPIYDNSGNYFNSDTKWKGTTTTTTGRFPANLIHDGSLEIQEARFFYCTKTSTGERNTGCKEMEDVIGDISNIAGKRLKCRTCGKWYITSDNCKCEKPDWIMPVTKNNHPTVKSVKLMSYLINLIMPPNGIVLDPFMGSGTTGIAALLNGYDFIGIEKQEEYMLIAEARINKYEEFRKYLK